MSEAFDRWTVLKKKVREGGGTERVERHRAAGKLTARDRLEAFFDPGSFTEIDAFVTHRVEKFGMEERRVPVTASSRAGAKSRGGRSARSRRTPPSSEARSERRTR